MSGDGGAVGWVGLAVSLIFIAVAMAVTSGFHLKLNRPIVVAVARSLVQMGIVGFALVLLVDPDTSIWWSWAWTVGIIGFASMTVTRRAPRVPGLFLISVTAYTTIAVTSLAVIFGFGIFELNSRALVPVAGMVIGNSMKVGVVAATRVSEFASDQRAEVEAGLALGMSVRRASSRLLRSALRTAISPAGRADRSTRHRLPAGRDDGPDPGGHGPVGGCRHAAGADVRHPRRGGHRRGHHRDRDAAGADHS